MTSPRDKAGRFRPGFVANPNGRPKKKRGVDAAITGAVQESVTVTEKGRSRSLPKLKIAATQLANLAAAGDQRAIKLIFDLVRKAEEHAENAAGRAPVMTQSDHEIANRVIARLVSILSSPPNVGGPDKDTASAEEAP